MFVCLFSKHTNVVSPARFHNFSVPLEISCGCQPFVELKLSKGVELLVTTLFIQHNVTVPMTHYSLDI